MASDGVPQWLAELVSTFGQSCKDKLAGPGDREAAIRTPIETLLGDFGRQLGLDVVPYDEVRDAERSVRPDYAISVDGVITGYVEVKKPGHDIDPTTFRGHDLKQWNRQNDLPNLVYTNGTEWRLWRDGEQHGESVTLAGGSLQGKGEQLVATDSGFERLLTEFLRWAPAPITSVNALVEAIAPLTRLLRSEVLDQLHIERQHVKQGADELDQPFLGLARDWRALLFPQADDLTFADGYAQTVTFALLLAKSEGLKLAGVSLYEVGQSLGEGHSLMGRALQLLTDSIAQDFKVTLDLLLRVIDAANWDRIRKGRRDTYLYLYENFLDAYDPDLRKSSGSYYTPREIVEYMVQMVEDVLMTRLGKADGFGDPNVMTVDPAMGTGTYLHTIIERVAEEASKKHGRGVASGVIEDFAKRIAGFELQMGPYAVAELRTTDLLRRNKAKPPKDGMRTYVTNTLDDPYADVQQLSYALSAISASRRRANVVKANTPVTVVIGNPPYKEKAEGKGGWIEAGQEAEGSSQKKFRPLDDFRVAGNGQAEYVLKNLYVYFWRWATWKVFDAHPSDRAGVVCFITTSGFLRGAGFKGMREYLRRTASEGWIINVTPEGHQPEVPTRVFPGVQQPLAISLFVRHPETDTQTPAHVRYTSVSGKRADKYAQLKDIDIDGDGWRDTRTGWQAPFTPAAESAWDEWPALNDLMPWNPPGVKPNRTWVYAPHQDILDQRWRIVTSETDEGAKRALFKTTASTGIDVSKEPLPGPLAYEFSGPFTDESGPLPEPVQVGYRAFDRQWIIPDSRMIHRASPSLWSAQFDGQVHAVEQPSKVINQGPGVVFTSLIPDMDHFVGIGGGGSRVLPLLHPDGSANIAPKFCDALTEVFDSDVAINANDTLAYIAGVTAHSGFTEKFTDELTTPGIRVPITLDPELWNEAVEIGRYIIWLHTYGQSYVDDVAGRPLGNVRYPSGDARQPLADKPITSMPEKREYDSESNVLHIGDGAFLPVQADVIEYVVGAKNVIKSWFDYRKSVPSGKRTSDLDKIHVDSWPASWTVELVDLLTVLTRLVEVEPKQADLLDRILAGKMARAQYLRDIGIRWPSRSKDRDPRYPMWLNGMNAEDSSPEQTILKYE